MGQVISLLVIEDIEELEAGGLHICLGGVAYAVHALVPEALDSVRRRVLTNEKVGCRTCDFSRASQIWRDSWGITNCISSYQCTF